MSGQRFHLSIVTRSFVVAVLTLVSLTAAKGPDDPVIVGSKGFTESVVLGETLTALARDAGVDAEHKAEMGGSGLLIAALEAGAIDAYPEYTGTLLRELLANEDLQDLDELRRSLRRRGIFMSASLGFNNGYVIGMPEAQAAELGISTISDLRDHPDLRLRFSNEWMDRSDGWPGLRAFYNLPQADVRGIEHSLAFRALSSDEADVTDLYGTDAEISAYNLRSLADDEAFFPRYDCVILFRADLATRRPDVVAAWRSLEGMIPAPMMIAANKLAAIDKRPPAEVARALLSAAYEGTDIDRVEETRPWWQVAWDRRDSLWKATLEHLGLVLTSVVAAVLVGVPLGLWAAKDRMVGRLVLPFVGILQTIPSLALLAFMIPLLALLGLTAIGFWPTVIALFLYLLLPIVANTQAGLLGIPRALIESADAISLSPWKRLLRVELPLAMPSILTGIKTSTVIAIGFATLGAFVAAGGYGDPIFKGIRLNDNVWLLLGAVPAALMAVLAQLGLTLLGAASCPVA